MPALLLAGSALIACEVAGEPTEGPAQYLSSVSSDCETCLVDLVECTSTSRDEADFVQCRDIFQSCQSGRGLGPDQCSNPTDEDACLLCNRRAKTCEGEKCAEQLSVCVALLATRASVCNAGAAPAPEKQGCAVCLDGLAACASTPGGDPTACSNTFGDCLAQLQVTVEACPLPQGARACDLCDAHKKLCELSAGATCEESFGACTSSLAGGECGGGGGGGGGGGTVTCAHNECAAGVKLDPACSDCAASVCEMDPFCCDTDYDDLCVAKAAQIALCGCDAGCAHSECMEGEALNPSCSACAGLVCDADPYCCTDAYDSYCLNEAANIPECGCGL